ncbi:MAG TPA: SRPBCC family protein [Candidatus Methylomirabilis sp.]|nr:SRPBCC family protein [Candidatus Methylomirabilis sp.]
MERSVTHATFVIERNFPVSPQRVFAAFADPAKKRRWFVENEEAPAEEFGMDFRVGGFERKRFHVKAGFVCENNTVYRDIVPDRRIVFAYTMSVGDNRISSSQSTVELLPTKEGTNLVFTEQAAFFEGADGPKMREQGWRLLFDNLARALAN